MSQVNRTKGPRVWDTPESNHEYRLVCPECNHIEYQNPKIVAGIVITYEGQYLLCRRAIEPRKGFWTLPAGFLELNESPKEGALREAWEEACVRPELRTLLAVYTIRRIHQIQMFFAGSLAVPDFAAGEESLEVQLFSWSDIPWEALAFPTVKWGLEHHYRWKNGNESIPPFFNPTTDENDPPPLRS